MDFALSSDQEMIRDTAEAFLAEASSSAAVRAAMETATGFDPAVWTRVGQELGWCATPIPEAYEGLGLGSVELVLLMEQMGRRLLCAPFYATVGLAAQVLLEVAEDSAKQRYLPAIASGELTATVALAKRGMDWQPRGDNGIDAAISVGAGGNVINGSFAIVADGATADLLIVPARDITGAVALYAFPSTLSGITRTPLKNFDLTRRVASVTLNNVQLPADAQIATPQQVAAAMPRAVAKAQLALAAEQLGGAQQCLDLTVAYTSERVQFGRTIASFQAIKHRCAEMMVKIEATRSAIYGAAAVAENPALAADFLLEAAAAKALASDTYCHCAAEAIQLHGGVGFTWEYDPQLYFKRAQASAHWLGSSDALRERIAGALLDAA
ncbi:Acyl-CoA dehydrogenase [Sterolibacterium denitrificans]|uniref:Acyl-CoA dehydrogenase n=1 Tax=Sterolibacterium denitrificans TaxID=157592 RepID=A0A7Z7HQ37_9PROT|nr:acyl-CoA dehydrogenase family protein [Sterolibacterium denitrificans]SMB23110.1 Acyl-CoA dehydrogenase [Sterolibacterium denitrificans]